jgi:hypothetical protein
VSEKLTGQKRGTTENRKPTNGVEEGKGKETPHDQRTLKPRLARVGWRGCCQESNKPGRRHLPTSSSAGRHFTVRPLEAAIDSLMAVLYVIEFELTQPAPA